jgi:hypothetical protein
MAAQGLEVEGEAEDVQNGVGEAEAEAPAATAAEGVAGANRRALKWQRALKRPAQWLAQLRM